MTLGIELFGAVTIIKLVAYFLALSFCIHKGTYDWAAVIVLVILTTGFGVLYPVFIPVINVLPAVAISYQIVRAIRKYR